MAMRFSTLAVFALLAPLAAAAQPALDDTASPEAWTGDATLAQPGVGDAARAFERVIGQLRQDLPLEFTGDPAADYALRARALATAARDLAEQFLAEASEETGPDLRGAAQAIVAQGQDSLDAIERWLADNPPPEPTPEPDTIVPQAGQITADPVANPASAEKQPTAERN